MLSPDNPQTPVILAILSALILGAVLFNTLFTGSRPYRRFVKFNSSWKRRRLMRKWVIQSLVFFGGLSVIALIFAWQFVPLLIADARELPGLDSDIAWIVLGVVILAMLLLPLLRVQVGKKGRTRVARVVEMASLMPRNKKELRIAGELALNAALVEELFFRLALPALLFGLSRNAVIALAVSVAAFGVVHAYRGLTGILSTSIEGVVFMATFVLTGTIIVPIIVHALFELRSLVLVPVVFGKIHTVRARW